MYHLWPFLLVHAFCVLRNICLIQDEKKIYCISAYLFICFFHFSFLAVLGLFCSMGALCCGVQDFSGCGTGTGRLVLWSTGSRVRGLSSFRLQA